MAGSQETDAVARAIADYENALRGLESIRDRARRLQVLLTATSTLEELPLCQQLSLNVRSLELLFDSCSDWVMRQFHIAGGRKAAVTYIEGMVDRSDLEQLGLKPLMYDAFPVRGPVD